MAELANASSTTLQIGGAPPMSLDKVTEADDANFEVSGGASLTLPALKSYTGGGFEIHSTLAASVRGQRPVAAGTRCAGRCSS